MSIYTPEKMVGDTQISVLTETTYYTVPSVTKVILKELVIVNTSASAVMVGVSVVTSSKTANVSNRILPDQVLPALSTTILDLALVMTAGDFISAKAGTINVVNIFASGVSVI